MSAFQSAQALSSQSESMLSQAKSLVPKNQTSIATSISKVATDLTQLKNSIDTKRPYDMVENLVQKTIYPDLQYIISLEEIR